MLADPTGEHQGIQARQGRRNGRDPGGRPAYEHVDGQLGARVPVRCRSFDLAHTGLSAIDPHQAGLVVERRLELPRPGAPGAQHI